MTAARAAISLFAILLRHIGALFQKFTNAPECRWPTVLAPHNRAAFRNRRLFSRFQNEPNG